MLLVSGFTQTTSSDNATVGLDFTFTCVTTESFIAFTRDTTTACTITGGHTDGTCVLTGSYIADYAYTCNPTTNTYTVTIPGSYHLWHRYSITVNQVMVATVKRSKWWLQRNQ
jgi:hypothetical protein